MKLSGLYKNSPEYKNSTVIDDACTTKEHQHVADRCIAEGSCSVVNRVSPSLVRIANTITGQPSLARIVVPEAFVVADWEVE